MTSTIRLALAVAMFCALPLSSGCASDPAPEPVAQQPAEQQVDPIYEKDPDMRGASANEQVAVREDKDPRKRVIFLNDFGTKHANLVVDQLKGDSDFSEFLPGGGEPRRVVVECKYTGDNLRVSVSKAIEAVGIPYHFREAVLAKHLEVYRSKQ